MTGLLPRKPLVAAICLVVAVVGVLSMQPIAGQAGEAEGSSQEGVVVKERKWLRLYHDGQLVSIAYIDQDTRPITKERREMELNVLQRFKVLNNQTAHDAFLKRKGYISLIPNVLKSIGDLIQARCDYQLLPEDGKVPALTKEFSRTVHDMWKCILREGDNAWAAQQADLKLRGEKPRRSTESEVKAIIKQLNEFSDLAIAVVSASPVGLFLDWSTLFIGDKHIGAWAGPIVTFCRRDGFGGAIKLANIVVDYIKDIDWGGDNTPKLMIDVPMMMVGPFFKCAWKQPDGTVLYMTMAEIKREQKKRAKRAERDLLLV